MNTDAGQVTQGDITIESNHETSEEIQQSFPELTPASPVSDASAPDGQDPGVAPAPSETESPTDASASADEPESLDAKDSSKGKANRRKNPTEAVKSAVAKQREAERRAEAAEAKIQEMSATPPPEAAPSPPDWERFKQMPGVPTVDQFTNYEDYSMAMSSFIADARYQERESERALAYQAHRQREADEVKISQWNERLTAARASNPDFDTSLNLETPMSLPMQHLAMESPHGIEILQWLSDNPKESQRISTLHPAETYREMGKLEARLEAAPSRASARVVSNAKPPVRPLGTSPHVADEFVITDDLSFDEHFRRANAADRAKGRL
jgi:hypothetical protein